MHFTDDFFGQKNIIGDDVVDIFFHHILDIRAGVNRPDKNLLSGVVDAGNQRSGDTAQRRLH